MLLKNLNISRAKQDKSVKQKAFCGERNRHCTVYIKNAEISLLHNGEDKFLKNLQSATSHLTHMNITVPVMPLTRPPFWGIVAMPEFIVTCVQSSDVSSKLGLVFLQAWMVVAHVQPMPASL